MLSGRTPIWFIGIVLSMWLLLCITGPYKVRLSSSVVVIRHVRTRCMPMLITPA
ncbi:hypothetical protein LO908_004236 [Aeromonas hydrophila]|nr:hypothetical protein [Aeromonas hydrophila]